MPKVFHVLKSTAENAQRRQLKVADRIIKTWVILFLIKHNVNPATADDSEFGKLATTLCELLSSFLLKAKIWRTKGHPYNFLFVLFGKTIPEWEKDKRKQSLAKLFSNITPLSDAPLKQLKSDYFQLLEDIYQLFSKLTFTRGLITKRGDQYNFDFIQPSADSLASSLLSRVYQETRFVLVQLERCKLPQKIKFDRTCVERSETKYFSQQDLTSFIAQKLGVTPIGAASAQSDAASSPASTSSSTTHVQDEESAPLLGSARGNDGAFQERGSIQMSSRGGNWRQRRARRRSKWRVSTAFPACLFLSTTSVLTLFASTSSSVQKQLLRLELDKAFAWLFEQFKGSKPSLEAQKAVGIIAPVAIASLLWLVFLIVVFCCCCKVNRRRHIEAGYDPLEADPDQIELYPVNYNVATDAVGVCGQIVNELKNKKFKHVHATMVYHTYKGSPGNSLPDGVEGLDSITYPLNQLFKFTYFLPDGTKHTLHLTFEQVKLHTKEIMRRAEITPLNEYRDTAIQFVRHVFEGENDEARALVGKIVSLGQKIDRLGEGKKLIPINVTIGDNEFVHTGSAAVLQRRLKFLNRQLPKPKGGADAAASAEPVKERTPADDEDGAGASVTSSTTATTTLTRPSGRITTVPPDYSDADNDSDDDMQIDDDSDGEDYRPIAAKR